MIVSRLLAYWIQVPPYRLRWILHKVKDYKIPDEILANMTKEYVEKYAEWLYLSSCEMSNDWSRWHDILKELWFSEVRQESWHRVFVSLEYPKLVIEMDWDQVCAKLSNFINLQESPAWFATDKIDAIKYLSQQLLKNTWFNIKFYIM